MLATGRQPSARLDAQLRGRAGRQGEAGESLLLASLDDAALSETLPRHLLAMIARDPAALSSADRRTLVAQAQRIGEARRADRREATREYSRAIADQRRAVLTRRDRIEAAAAPSERDDDADGLRARLPEHLAALERADPDATRRLRTRLSLFTLDEAWVRHLALLHEVRDGIHLRSLAGQRPAAEFHLIALREFSGFFDAAANEAAGILAGLGPEDLRRDLAGLGLRRPGTTWTYLVSDDPFGSAMDRAAGRLGRSWRARVLPLE